MTMRPGRSPSLRGRARRRARRTAPRLLLAALATVALASCRHHERIPAPPAANELIVGLESAPGHLDPRVATDQASDFVFQLLMDGLMAKRPDGSLVPGLAESWDILDDGKRYRFHIRPVARFHDGRPLRAADVAWTFNSILEGKVPTSKKAAYGPLSHIEVVDELTVDFVLREPWGGLLINLTPGEGIVPEGTMPEDMQRHPIGSGPYRFVSRAPDRIVLEAWDDYPGGRSPLDRVIFREVPDATVRALELEKGSVHLVVNALPPDTVTLFENRPGFQVSQRPGANYVYLGLNLEDPVLRDVRVRRALAHAVDRPRIARTVWRGQGVATETLLPPGHWARNEHLPTIRHDPAEAARLLEEAGYRDPDGDGPRPRLALSFKVSNNELFLLQAQAVQAMLAEAGIEATIRSFEFATFYADVKRGAFQMFSLTWTGIADPDFYRNVFHSGSIPPVGANRGRYRSAEADRLITEGGRRFEPLARRPFYVQLQEVVHRDLPYVSLLTRNTVAVMLAGLEGYEGYPSGELYSIRKMRWRRGGASDARAGASP